MQMCNCTSRPHLQTRSCCMYLCLYESQKMFMWTEQNHTAFNSNMRLRQTETKRGLSLPAIDCLCDLFSLLLLRLEYHPLDPLTGISDSVDTVVRSAAQTECHQSTSQHTIKMTSAGSGCVYIPAEACCPALKLPNKVSSSLAQFNRMKVSR